MAFKLRGKAGALAGAVSLAVGLLVGLEGRHPDGVYVDIAGVLTDCYGNTKNVKRGWVRSEAECKALLEGEAERIGTYIQADVPDIPESVLAATISWAYNVGEGNVAASTLAKRFQKGEADYGRIIREEFPKWRSKGLTAKRRAAEIRLAESDGFE